MTRLLPWSKVAPLVGISRQTAERLEGKGMFPSRRRVPGATRYVYVEDEIEKWVAARVRSV